MYIVCDFVMTSLAFFVFNILRFCFLHPDGENGELWHYLGGPKLVVEQVAVPVFMLGIYALSGYYNCPFPRSRLHEFIVTLGSAVVNTIIIFLVLLINDPTPKQREEYMLLILVVLVLFVLTYTGRLLITSWVLHIAKRHPLPYTTLIIGDTPKGREIGRLLQEQNTLYEPRILGYMPLNGENPDKVEDRAPVFSRDSLRETCLKYEVDQVVLAPSERNDTEVLSILDEIIDLDIPIKIAPDDVSYAMSGIRLDDVLGVPLLDLASPRIGPMARNLKRVFDVTLSILGLILLSPVLIGIAIAVRKSSPGPVFYSQERIGKNHHPFNILKFRSMYTDAEAEGPRLSSDSDPRITPVGRILRKYRLDELPQLLNVIRGEMSIVGPRPERDYYIRQIVKRVPYYSLVFQIRPGITSWAMVKYGYASSIEQMCARTPYDLMYITNMSLLLDMRILVYTVLTILKGSGK